MGRTQAQTQTVMDGMCGEKSKTKNGNQNKHENQNKNKKTQTQKRKPTKTQTNTNTTTQTKNTNKNKHTHKQKQKKQTQHTHKNKNNNKKQQQKLRQLPCAFFVFLFSRMLPHIQNVLDQLQSLWQRRPTHKTTSIGSRTPPIPHAAYIAVELAVMQTVLAPRLHDHHRHHRLHLYYHHRCARSAASPHRH